MEVRGLNFKQADTPVHRDKLSEIQHMDKLRERPRELESKRVWQTTATTASSLISQEGKSDCKIG